MENGHKWSQKVLENAYKKVAISHGKLVICMPHAILHGLVCNLYALSAFFQDVPEDTKVKSAGMSS